MAALAWSSSRSTANRGWRSSSCPSRHTSAISSAIAACTGRSWRHAPAIGCSLPTRPRPSPFPSGNSGGDSAVLDAETSDFSARSRKARICAEAYSCTPHKEIRRLTPRLQKSAVSGRELARTSHRVSTADGESRRPAVLVAHRAPRRSATTTASPDSRQSRRILAPRRPRYETRREVRA